jgi:hypothetical protein
MFKILGGDGKEYGPVTTDTVREWILQGRASAATLVRREESPDWKPLSAHPELATLLPAAAAPLNPVIPTSQLAIWSLVAGVSGFMCLFTGPIGVVLGFLARSRIKRSEGKLAGNGLALAGIITGALSLLLAGASLALVLPMMKLQQRQAFQRAHTINCVNNTKQLSLAVRLYMGDNGDTFPSATNWCDAVFSNVGSQRVFWCPGETNQARSAYALNAAVAGLKEADVPSDTVVLFESDAGWNASGGVELMITQPRHGDRWVVGYADGSVHQLTAAQLSTLKWNPASTNKPATSNP